MDPRLIARWLAGCDPIAMRDEASASQVRERVRAVAGEVGLDRTTTERLVVAASELAMNVLRHAREGSLAVRMVRRLGTPGVEVVAADRGPGIAGAAAALAGSILPREAGASLGAGLGAARRMSQELDVDTRLGEGTCIRVRAFAAPVPRSEFAVHGQALAGERVSGDDAAVVRGEDALHLIVADGLGHGPEAREASAAVVDAAAALLAAHPVPTLGDVLARAADAAKGTRGAVVALLRVSFTTRALEHTGLGDVQALRAGPAGTQLLPSRGGFLSGRRDERALAGRVTEGHLGPHDVVVAFTDGLRSGAAAARSGPPGEPIALAQDLAARFARGTDDLLVAVAR